ncbi:MAG TPA: SAM-dependent methyltransferase [Flavitalea sp.]|nr:SAM-dependent methyltransferase [Flavitalea sp.]
MPSIVYLIPTVLAENSIATLPPYLLDAVKECRVFFVENERTARRFLKLLWKEIRIDDYQWYTIHKAEAEVRNSFLQYLKEEITIGVLSESGCPGIADPGQILIEAAHDKGAIIRPLVGPSALLLALMGSGMNGQHFQFLGYLPVDTGERIQAIRTIEAESAKKNCTQLFIETPYRTNQLLEALLKTCRGETRLCIACDLTASAEFIHTKPVSVWRKHPPDLHKHQVVFLLHAR